MTAVPEMDTAVIFLLTVPVLRVRFVMEVIFSIKARC